VVNKYATDSENSRLKSIIRDLEKKLYDKKDKREYYTSQYSDDDDDASSLHSE